MTSVPSQTSRLPASKAAHAARIALLTSAASLSVTTVSSTSPLSSLIPSASIATIMGMDSSPSHVPLTTASEGLPLRVIFGENDTNSTAPGTPAAFLQTVSAGASSLVCLMPEATTITEKPLAVTVRRPPSPPISAILET